MIWSRLGLPLGMAGALAIAVWFAAEQTGRAAKWEQRAAEYAGYIADRDALIATSEARRLAEQDRFAAALKAQREREAHIAQERNKARLRAAERAHDLKLVKEANDALLVLLDTVADDWLRYNCRSAAAAGITPVGECRDRELPDNPAPLRAEERER